MSDDIEKKAKAYAKELVCKGKEPKTPYEEMMVRYIRDVWLSGYRYGVTRET